MAKQELAWASGLFEGEGCISLSFSNGKHRVGYPRLDLAMTDEDWLKETIALGYAPIMLTSVHRA